MLERLWTGRTRLADADDYEELLREELLPRFDREGPDGYRGGRVLRRDPEPADGDELVEFVTLLRFDSLAAVRGFAGEDYRSAHVPAEARALLAEYDERARHYELVIEA